METMQEDDDVAGVQEVENPVCIPVALYSQLPQLAFDSFYKRRSRCYVQNTQGFNVLSNIKLGSFIQAPDVIADRLFAILGFVELDGPSAHVAFSFLKLSVMRYPVPVKCYAR